MSYESPASVLRRYRRMMRRLRPHLPKPDAPPSPVRRFWRLAELPPTKPTVNGPAIR